MADPATSNTPAAPEDPLQAFRRIGNSRRPTRQTPPLSLRETLLLWAALPPVLAPAWFGGAMFWWSGLLCAGLALLPVLVALCPLKNRHDTVSPSATPGEVLLRVLKFPIFWLGLLFLGYITIQGLNYEWVFTWTENRKGYFMQRLPEGGYIPWLPTGMQSPFKMMNPWQTLLVWLTPWLTVCAAWGVLRRRKAWRVLLWQIAVLGAAVALIGVAVQMTAPKTVMWIWKVRNELPFGPFAYRNQGSVILYLGFAAATSLFFHYQRTERGYSGIQWFALTLGLVCLTGSVSSFSRAGWVATAIIVLGAAGLFVLRVLWQRDFGASRLITGVLITALLLTAASFALKNINFADMNKRWASLAQEGGDKSFNLRLLVAGKTYQMFRDNPWTGWGAGSFRFYFPVYQQGDRRLTHLYPDDPKSRWRLNWRYAHSDWMQFLAEYGIIGCSFLLLGMLYWLGITLRRLTSLKAEHWILLLAAIVTISQASLDIVFFNPVILLTFSLTLACLGGLVQAQPDPRHSR